ncbi:Rad52/Rad22 family DNA repair protein [Candidatus Sulfurimonas baltica]|uniref:DNA repair protein Rad52 n=1 Tax=Candidatus Sulfurimonas baltica TaxID=2740404 RepID=A0A7S7RNK0_9BACT|nr:Rad52/Rad22 family DNA repair protein [Candidatus Sulfurimonas baltica]QOY52631.1 DNA repair protein Rad52 [Candidatus Sulfurimonas baltica]
MFNDKTNQVLGYEIESSRIKSRQKGNITLSYLEGFDIIETANRVFGFGNWDYSTKLEVVSQEVNQNQNHVICYKALVSILVHDVSHSKQVSREDVGFGTGIAKTLADAHEGGAKEAVTDAIKRTLRSFGNQFGNSLYDKSRQHQNNQMQNQQSAQIQQYQTPVPEQLPSQQQSHNPNDYSSLYNIGLQVVDDNNGNLLITGDDIYNKRDSIKACGFKFDPSSKQWWKPVEQQQAA